MTDLPCSSGAIRRNAEVASCGRALHGTGLCPCGPAVEPADVADLDGLDLDAAERDLEASVCCASFADFVRGAWPIVEPTRALLPSVAMDAIVAVLQEAAERGGRWAIACPPGVSKSIVCSILWPAWLLLRSGGAARVMCGSYAWELASRDSLRCRTLIESPWYVGLVAGAWSVRSDADRRDDFWTTGAGRRLVTSTGAKATGERATFQVLDDVLSATDALSAAKRKEAARWVCEVMPSRLEDPERDCRVIVGQRLHPEDPIGVVLDQGGWRYLRLPALADEHPCELRRDDGTLIWRDPRAPGEPLVALLGADALARLKVELGSGAFAAQYGQAPADDSTATIKRAWWRFYRPPHAVAGARRPTCCDDSPAAELPATFERITIGVDLTFGSMTGDYAVAQAWGAVGGARYLLDQWRARAGFEDQLAAITALAKKYPTAKVVIEKAANGAAVIETLRKAVAGVVPVTPQGSKVQRLSAVAPTIESGACYLPEGAAYVEAFVEELAGATKHDDAQDACAYALIDLMGAMDPAFEEERANVLRAISLCYLGNGPMTLAALEAMLPERFRPARPSDLPSAPDHPDRIAAGAAAAQPTSSDARPTPRTAEEWREYARVLSAANPKPDR